MKKRTILFIAFILLAIIRRAIFGFTDLDNLTGIGLSINIFIMLIVLILFYWNSKNVMNEVKTRKNAKSYIGELGGLYQYVALLTFIILTLSLIILVYFMFKDKIYDLGFILFTLFLLGFDLFFFLVWKSIGDYKKRGKSRQS